MNTRGPLESEAISPFNRLKNPSHFAVVSQLNLKTLTHFIDSVLGGKVRSVVIDQCTCHGIHSNVLAPAPVTFPATRVTAMAAAAAAAIFGATRLYIPHDHPKSGLFIFNF